MKLWRTAMEPESYAPLVKCPILFLDASNDQHGKMDWAMRTLNAVPAQNCWAFTPRYRHHISAELENDLPLWMDTWLKRSMPVWPKTPEAAVSLDRKGIPQLTVTPDKSKRISRVDLFYAVENRNPKNRFWRSADGPTSGKSWSASLPVLAADQPLFAFANVHYESGICLSSPLVTAIPAQLGKAKATDKPSLLIDDFAHGTDDWIVLLAGPDPIPPMPYLVTNAVGPNGKRGVTTRAAALSTHKIGDPKWRGPDGAKLQFEVYANAARELKIAVIANERTKEAKEWKAAHKLADSAQWQRVSLTAEDFKDEKSEPLPDWRAVQLLEISSVGVQTSQPIYADFRWIPKNAK
jgi:hypothetical protein